MLKLCINEQFKMQSPTESSIIYNDSGYFTHNPEVNSLSSNSNSDPSFEINEEVSLHIKPETSVQSSSAIYFCENAVFDEPKLTEPQLLCDSNNYEQFSSLIKFSLEETSSNYLTNSNLDYYVQNRDIFDNIVTEAAEECSTNAELSPELFSDTESENETQIIEIEPSFSENLTQSQKQKPISDEFAKNDRKLLKRVQETLSGVPPPPAFTIIQFTIEEMLEKIKSNKHLFLEKNINDEYKEDKKGKNLLISCTKNDLEGQEWPEIMNFRYHGLHFNRSTVSEDFELSCSRYSTRYVGCETSSSCTWWSTTGPQRKGQRPTGSNNNRWAPKSPGRRLSHLARRRITFSSANLQQNASLSANKLMIDTRKSGNKLRRSPRKSPWKKSPQKKVKTPNSSSKKRFASNTNKASSSKMSSTKRALFQSPEHKNVPAPTEIKSRRALFSSPTKKRKRVEDDAFEQPNKFPRSQSFDVQQTQAGGSMQRRNSEVILRPGKGELSELHKQKMLWAVSESLRAHQITMSHPQFRHFASILCKIIKLQVPDLLSNNGPRQPGSTSDRMLKIARKHVYDVTRGKTYPEILQNIQKEDKHFKQPKGYVAPPEKQVLKDKILNIQEDKRKYCEEENSKLKSIKRQILFDDNR